MRLEIRSVTIENFKGITGPFTVEFSDGITAIYGANHRGKTTVMDAILWLLFGKNSEESANFGIDPLDEKGEVVHGLENKVSGTFVKDGREIALQRVRKEVWKKNRGEDDGTYSHTTSFFVDGEKYTERDYKQYINDQIIQENLFKALTNPQYFPSLKSEDQRRMLITMAGDVNDREVASMSAELSKVFADMKGDTIEGYRMHLSYKKKDIKKELEAIPGRLMENQNALAQAKNRLDDYDIEPSLKDMIAKCDAQIAEKEAMLADMSKSVDTNYDALARLREQLAKMRGDVQRMERSVETYNSNVRFEHESQLRTLRSRVSGCDVNISNANAMIQRVQTALNEIAVSKDDFRKRWTEVEGMKHEWSGSETCQSCGQRLPEEQIETLKQNALAAFDQMKQRKQDALDEEAKQLKENERKNLAMIEYLRRQIQTEETTKAGWEQQLTDAEETAVVLKDAKDDPKYGEMQQAIARLEQEIAQLAQPKQEETDLTLKREQLKREKIQLQMNRDALRDDIAAIHSLEGSIKRYEARIAELSNEERALNQQLTELESREFGANAFNTRKIEMLQERVNGLFDHIQFKMFNTLQNGDKVPTCECTLHGTPYIDLSNSEKINAGLDIIRALARFYENGAVFCMIDNAEASNEIWPTGGQQIHLIVSHDQELRVVYE